MARKLSQRDPIGRYQREATAARRIGVNKQCACGETRPEALIEGSNPTICAACDRNMRGQRTLDDHHPALRANNPAILPVPVNDHRARLSSEQYDWPQETRENPDGSPLLAAAACLRGFSETNVYLIEKLLLSIPEMLETLDAMLLKAQGRKWWRKTQLEKFAPKRKSNVTR